MRGVVLLFAFMLTAIPGVVAEDGPDEEQLDQESPEGEGSAGSDGEGSPSCGLAGFIEDNHEYYLCVNYQAIGPIGTDCPIGLLCP